MHPKSLKQKVFFSVGVSLEGFMAGPNASPQNAMGDGAASMHEWIMATKSWRKRMGLEGGDADTADEKIVKSEFDDIGAWIIGDNMFKEGKVAWPENAPFRVPVYVLTQDAQEPWERPGGTTFYFVTDGIESALKKARAAAGDKDVRIGGGANTMQQYVNAGLVDEFRIDYSTLFLGKGLPLFAGMNPDLTVKVKEVVASPHVTHVTYQLLNTKQD